MSSAPKWAHVQEEEDDDITNNNQSFTEVAEAKPNKSFGSDLIRQG